MSHRVQKKVSAPQADSVGATAAVHRGNDGYPTGATANKRPAVLTRRSVITQRQMPTIQKIQRTVEILQVQFVDELVDVPVVMHCRCL